MNIEINDYVDELVKGVVFSGLRSYNDKFAKRNQMDFSIVAKHDEKIVGVAMGESKYDWLILQYLWIEELFRGQGLGNTIIKNLETLARKRNLVGIHLDTFEFQARGFYEKSGFVLFGEIDDHPSGYKRYFMKKNL